MLTGLQDTIDHSISYNNYDFLTAVQVEAKAQVYSFLQIAVKSKMLSSKVKLKVDGSNDWSSS